MMTQLMIVMKDVVMAFPQEWEALLPAVEHLMHTAPKGAHGISAHDLSCAWSIASDKDTILAPFRVPRGVAESDQAVNLFNGSRGMFALYTRSSMEAAMKTHGREQVKS